MLLIVGNKDKTVPYHQTLEMEQKLKAAGVPTELIVIPNVDHVFIGNTLEQTRDATLKALAATFEFIDKVMSAATSHERGAETPTPNPNPSARSSVPAQH
jgi:dipeptidyl aminopeptidase/acylaminoacyl peptidase